MTIMSMDIPGSKRAVSGKKVAMWALLLFSAALVIGVLLQPIFGF